MECWRNGVLGLASVPNTPILHHSITANLLPFLRGFIRFDRVDAMMVPLAMDFEFDLVTHFVVEQSLSHRRKITDDTLFRVRIPSAQDGEVFGLIGFQIR